MATISHSAANGGQKRIYNYPRFTPEEYDFTVDEALQAGDMYHDAALLTLSGKSVRLSGYLKDRPLVLETGSMTCPMYAQSVPPMMELIKKYPELDHVLLYVREAHPGEMLRQHPSAKDKISAAIKVKKVYGDTREILVDDIHGSAHNWYGNMPNSIFVIAPDGKIIFRSIWNNTNQIDEIFRAISRGEAIESRELKAIPPFSLRGIRTLFRGGFIAFWDFITGLPKLVANHRAVGNM